MEIISENKYLSVIDGLLGEFYLLWSKCYHPALNMNEGLCLDHLWPGSSIENLLTLTVFVVFINNLPSELTALK